MGLLKQAVEQLFLSSACAGVRLVQVPRAIEQHHLHWFHQGKNELVTSQDLFKTQEKIFFTDIRRVWKRTSVWKRTVWKRTGKVFSPTYRDCRATSSIMLPWENPFNQKKSALLDSVCVSAWAAEHAFLPHHSWNMEAMHLLPTYSGKSHSSPGITLVSLQSTGSHVAAATWCFCYWRQTSKYFASSCKSRPAESWKEVLTSSEFSHWCLRAPCPKGFWNKASSVPSTTLHWRS